MTTILKADSFSVEQRGIKVAVIIGNAELLMDYKTGLRLCGLLRLRCQQAKLEDGHSSPIFGVYGDLQDLEDIVKREQQRKMF